MPSSMSGQASCGRKRFGYTAFPALGESRGHTTVAKLSANSSASVFDGTNLSDSDNRPSLFPSRNHEVLSSARAYWMPDRLCSTCYECELPFNMCRRRHHCRLCGQIFCHSCSSYSVDGKCMRIIGTVRACKACHQHLKIKNQPALFTSALQTKAQFPATYSLSAQQQIHGASQSTNDHNERVECGESPSAGQVNYRPHQASTPFSETWSGSIADSVEASLRRRLIGTSSFVVPVSILKATSRNQESPASMTNFERVLQDIATDRLRGMVTGLMYKDNSLKAESRAWESIILGLAQRACNTVDPRVNCGDNMDVRPFIKIKVIPGGSSCECCYIDGIVFRQAVIHKRMRKAAYAPRILLLSSGIDFQRAHSKLSSFGILTEQEQKYTEIIVEKVIRLRPQVLCVGHSICRHAQEFLQQHDVIAIQHAKQNLMQRIARLTRAVILPSIEQATSMSQHRNLALGTCQHFQITAYPSALRCHKHLAQWHTLTKYRPHIKRKRGRGYFRYVYLTGSTKFLGCTLVLRGAEKKTLKKIKRLLNFAIFVAYHLRLECSFLKDSGAGIPRPQIDSRETKAGYFLSSSLGVSFKNCESLTTRPLTSAMDHQSLLLTSVWMIQHAQCALAEVRGILYYTPQDVCLGQFLLHSCFNLDMKFPSGEKNSAFEITQIFYHNDGQLRITVAKTDEPLTGLLIERTSMDALSPTHVTTNTIFMWSYCKTCEKIVTPLIPMSDDTWKMSFGKYLEVGFYNKAAICRIGRCQHCIQKEHVFFYGLKNMVARFVYEHAQRYDIYLRHKLPFDRTFYCQELVLQYQSLRYLGFKLYKGFVCRHGELEAAIDEAFLAFCSPWGNGDEPCSSVSLLTIMLSVLGQLSIEIQCYATWLQNQLSDELDRHKRMSHCGNSGVLRVPTQFRRELYIRTRNWNQRYSLLGHFLRSVRDRAGSASWNSTDSSNHILFLEADAATMRSKGHEVEVVTQLFQNLTEPKFFSPSAIEEDVDEYDRPGRTQASSTLHSTRCLADFCRTGRGMGGAPNMQTSFRGNRPSSALGKILGQGCLEKDRWVVPLGELENGRPRLDLSSPRGVLLVHEEQPTTIIAYSLSTMYYKHTLAIYLESSQHEQACSTKTNIQSGVNEINDHDNKTEASEIASNICPPQDTELSSHIRQSNMTTQNHRVASSPSRNSDVNGDNFIHMDSCRMSKEHLATSKLDIHPIKQQTNIIRLEREMLATPKTHIKHRFADMDEKGNTLCKFVCQTYWAAQFAAVRKAYFGAGKEEELGFLRSLSMAHPWNAQGGKSGATFLKTADTRFVVKQITRTELLMFLECAPAYFEYLTKAFFRSHETLLVKVLGVYQIGSHNCVNGKRMMEQVVVMQNLFHACEIDRIFDLKGSTRSRYARIHDTGDSRASSWHVSNSTRPSEAKPVLLDENFMEFSKGRPLPLRDRAKVQFNAAVLNDTLFLSLINVVDYSILVGMDDKNNQLIVGIIDYLRQYDIIKKVERMGKSVGMIAGQAEPTVIQPANYRNRFQAAMEKYFMMVPDKWTSFRFQT